MILEIDGYLSGPCWQCGRTVNFPVGTPGNVAECDQVVCTGSNGALLEMFLCRFPGYPFCVGCGGYCTEPVVVVKQA